MNLYELEEKITAKRDALNTAFASYPDMTEDQVKSARALNDELTDLGKQADAARELDQINTERKARENDERKGARLSTPRTQPHAEPEAKSLHDELSSNADIQRFRAGQIKTAVMNFPYDYKTLITLTTINNVTPRQPGIRPFAEERRTVGDLMAQGTLDTNQFTYMTETAGTNAAAAVAEDGTKPESAMGFVEATEIVRKIGTWVPATDELLADVSGMDSYIRARLMFFVERVEETQLLSGSGVAPNLLGLLNRVGIQTQAKGADPTPDTVYKAMTKIRNTGFAEPDALIIHPNDWQDIKLLRTADGIYIWGAPMDEGPDRIWGLNVRITTAIPENTGLVGAFKAYAQLFRRQGITVTVSTEHSTYFVENKVAILAEERLALAVYRASAFCSLTGI